MSNDQNLTKNLNVETVEKIYFCRYVTFKETKEYKCKSKTKNKAINEGIIHFNLQSKNLEINTNTWFKDGKIIKNFWLRQL